MKWRGRPSSTSEEEEEEEEEEEDLEVYSNHGPITDHGRRWG